MKNLTISVPSILAATPPRPINKSCELTQFGERLFGVHPSYKANNINSIPVIAEQFFRQFSPFFLRIFDCETVEAYLNNLESTTSSHVLHGITHTVQRCFCEPYRN